MKQIQTQLAVIGGGPAGVCAALAAARLGVQTVLVHNRPVLGGNSSSEVRVWTRGATGAGNLFSEEMGVWGSLKLRNLYVNPDCNPLFWDEVLLDAVWQCKGLTLLLNTDVQQVRMEGGRVRAVQGCQQASEQGYELEAEYFIDATGDGLLGAKAGLPFQMGGRIYDTAQGPGPLEVLGSSILYYVKKTERPVRFVPPEYAYSMEQIEALVGKGGRIISEQQSGSDCWWFEYGGLQNTIAEAQDIGFELKRLVMGVWNYIKNSGKFNAACYTLEWVGSLPGKRESRRMVTDYVLTQADVLEHPPFADSGFYGGWYMDFHPAEGVGTAEPNCIQIPLNIYSVPLRCLYNRAVPNLLFAGRNIGTSREAFVSCRIMNTCALSGQAAGTLAWGCLEAGAPPAALSESQLEQVRQALLREDMFLPGVQACDAADLARGAQVSASSVFAGPGGPGGGEYPLDEGGFITFPAPKSGGVELRLRCGAPARLRGAFYAAPVPSRYCPGKEAGRGEWQAPQGESWLAVPLPEGLEGFCTLLLQPAPGVSLVLAEQRSPGILCGRQDRPEYADPCLRLDTTGFYGAENVIDGYARPYGAPHLWCSAPERAPWLQLRWPRPVTFNELRLYLDPELSMELPSSRAAHWDEHHKYAPRAGMPPQLARAFHLDALTEAGWKTVLKETENWRRLAVLRTEGPVTARAVRLVIDAAWGDERAHVYELRLYQTEQQPCPAQENAAPELDSPLYRKEETL